MVEFWDAYDKNFNIIKDVQLIRGENIPDGMYHLVGEVIVKHSDGTYLLMQRDLKKHYGGMWEVTAGGSALKDESAKECAIRELKEETGIEAFDLIELCRIVHDAHKTLYVEFLCITDCIKENITLQAGETINYKWVSKETIFNIKEDIASSRALNLMAENAL